MGFLKLRAEEGERGVVGSGGERDEVGGVAGMKGRVMDHDREGGGEGEGSSYR